MSDKVSIAELEAAEREMPSDWRYDHQGYIESMCRTLNHTGGETEVLVLGARNEHSDGEGIVAIRNAARALIAIAKAAQGFALAQETRDPCEFAQAEFDALWKALEVLTP